MTIVLAIAALCTTHNGVQNYTVFDSVRGTQFDCQKYYVKCMKKNTVTLLEKCIENKP